MQLIKSGGTKGSSVPSIVVKPDTFRHGLNRDMSEPTHSHRPSCYHGTEQDLDGHYDWQPWQDGHMYPLAFPANATRTLGADTVSPSSASSLEVRNNLSTPEAAFGDGFAAPPSNVDECLDFFEDSEFMLPPTAPIVLLDNQSGDWNCLFPTVPFPSTLYNLPSTLNTFSRSTLNQPAMSEDPSFGDMNTNSVRNNGSSASADDHSHPTYAGCYPSSLGVMEVTKI